MSGTEMKWQDVPLQKGDSKMRDLAIEKGILTMGEYEAWLNGYKVGYTERQNEVVKSVSEVIKEIRK